jgi:hypothetical protein
MRTFLSILFLPFIFLNITFAQQKIYSTVNFHIQYDESAVPSNSDPAYVSPFTKHQVKDVPNYVQDMGLYLQTAFDKYASMGLIDKMDRSPSYAKELKEKTPDPVPRIINIYVESIKDPNGKSIDGVTGLSGITINNLVPPDRGMSSSTALQKTCCHELLHFVTESYYSVMAANVATKWWWECLAVQADRLVYPGKKPYEAEQYAGESSQNLSFILQRSWDDCNEEPNWYTSGGFLAYLLHYRQAKTADFREIFLRPAQNKTSYTRDVLDTYLKELGSKGIGWEYHDYIKWCYDKKGFAAIDTAMADLAGNTHTIVVRLDEKFTADTLTTGLPYMAAKVFRIRNMEIKPKSVLVKNLSGSDNSVMYAYSCAPGMRTQITTLGRGDSILFSFKDKKQWIDVLTINTTKSQADNPRLVVVDAIDALGDYRGSADFTEDNSKMKSRYKITISDLRININDKNQVQGSIEFHMEYPKDGMLATCSDFSGKVDLTGKFSMKGRVQEINYPKCPQGCCTYELIKQGGSTCMKVTKYLYWHFTGKVKVSDNKKDIDGKIIVSPSVAMPKGDKAMLKFSVKNY